ncbi:hypothetical protein [Xanthomonas sp. CFBP 7912]|uniref:hypothetical protein n=1 Tax=Xanthomonas sp. CFBP 7912 TaxID=1891621 RepID=UPI000CEEA469|nr:hypothetical protein [Xanthomonas sp. CFBP 7912]PPU32376.1 hypothetical protein XspCFBP7912_12235 [Xanthomonas sp. CFBP 7912]
MRDEKDPGTLEMQLPRKQGRPPKYGEAMSAAQRAREYRRNRKLEFKPVSEMRDASLIDEVRRVIGLVADGYDQDILDMYIEELVKRHHSSRADLYAQRKP